MPGYPCCCSPTIVTTCAEFDAWLATKTQLEVTIAAELVGGGFSDCTDADCAAAIDGTYILTKISGSLGAGSCTTNGSNHTFSYTFSETIACDTVDDPYTGVAVDFDCIGTSVYMRLLLRHQFGCSSAYGHDGINSPIALPADLSSGSVLPFSAGSFSNPCVPTSASMTFAFL